MVYVAPLGNVNRAWSSQAAVLPKLSVRVSPLDKVKVIVPASIHLQPAANTSGVAAGMFILTTFPFARVIVPEPETE